MNRHARRAQASRQRRIYRPTISLLRLGHVATDKRLAELLADHATMLVDPRICADERREIEASLGRVKLAQLMHAAVGQPEKAEMH